MPAVSQPAMAKVKTRPGPATHIKNGEYSAATRALALGSYFISGCMAINASQFLGAPLYLINENWYNSWIAFTKQSWGLLTTSMTQCWAPTVVRVSGHKSVRGELMTTTDGDLLSNFPERMILIANHQIYTDWLYLWWIGYTNGMHGRIYVVLKESLRRIPVIGWGMQFSQFIFLKRNWEEDKDRLAAHLQKLNDAVAPMWLMLFPEGTNLHPETRKSSKKWADKNKIPDMQHQLLPRSKGLQFCIQQLRKTVPYVYDCTIAYEGVPTGQYASEIFTINAAYFGGKPPKSVNMYWRRFAIWSIPVDNDRDFDNWLRARWIEKDQLLDNYQKTGRFPADTGVDELADGKKRRGAGYIETEIKPSRWYEYLQIFAPVGMLAFVLYMFYGGLPKRFMKDIGQRAVEQSQLEGSENLEQMINSAPRIVEVDSTNASTVGAPTKIKITNQTPEAAKKAIKKLGPKQSGARNAQSRPKPTATQTARNGRKAKKLTVNNAASPKFPKNHVKSEVGAVSKPPETSHAATNRSAGEAPKKLEVRHGADVSQINAAAPKKLNTVSTSKKPPMHHDGPSTSAPPAAPKLRIKQPKLGGNYTKPKGAPANEKENHSPKKLDIKPKSSGNPSTKQGRPKN
ncbi:MAG: hypothetical protein Q9169_005162 [Polycauliona sp. 2 TL-2023]